MLDARPCQDDRVDLYISLEYMDRETWTKVIPIADAAPDERVLDRVAAEHGAPIFGPGVDGALVVWAPTGDPDGLIVFTHIPATTTFADLEMVFGGALLDPSGPVTVAFGGAGGFDAEEIVSFKWLLRPITWSLGKVVKVFDENLFAEERDGVARWRNTGVIDDHLIRHIRSHGVIWSAKLFSRHYAVSERERGELLRAAGYVWTYLGEERGHVWYDETAGSL